MHELVALDAVADVYREHRAQVLVRCGQAVDARDGGDDDHVAAAEQRAGRGMPQTLHLGVDRGVLLDEGVRLRHIRLGLVVVVIRHEVLYGVVRQQLAQLGGQLRGQGLVVREHEGRPLHPLDEPRGRGRLAGAGRTAQHDVPLAVAQPPLELVDRPGLVAGRLERALDLERTHFTLGLHVMIVAAADGATRTDVRTRVVSARRTRPRAATRARDAARTSVPRTSRTGARADRPAGRCGRRCAAWPPPPSRARAAPAGEHMGQGDDRAVDAVVDGAQQRPLLVAEHETL